MFTYMCGLKAVSRVVAVINLDLLGCAIVVCSDNKMVGVAWRGAATNSFWIVRAGYEDQAPIGLISAEAAIEELEA